MARILMFIYAMVLFVFLVVIKVGAASRNCELDSDCPNYLCYPPKVGKCYFHNCYCN
ncbi:late nodulin [Medicago truncatula]|uniref:Late nodulin n=1 Tax=Medicago truncatula TaxID=3880 RepID=G7JTD6_MEDTR|nr:late nodulin [Medicago truncatula]